MYMLNPSVGVRIEREQSSSIHTVAWDEVALTRRFYTRNRIFFLFFYYTYITSFMPACPPSYHIADLSLTSD